MRDQTQSIPCFKRCEILISFMKLCRNWINKYVSSFIFPCICVHCNKKNENSLRILCADCLSDLHILQKAGRCDGCFSVLNEKESCSVCQSEYRLYEKLAFVFEDDDILRSLLNSYHQKNRIDIAKVVASFLVIQWFNLYEGYPDFILWISHHGDHLYPKRDQLMNLVAEHMSEMMFMKKKSTLKTKVSFVKTIQPYQIKEKIFTVSDPISIKDKKILLIDDIFDADKLLIKGAEALEACSPSKIYLLSFCSSSF